MAHLLNDRHAVPAHKVEFDARRVILERGVGAQNELKALGRVGLGALVRVVRGGEPPVRLLDRVDRRVGRHAQHVVVVAAARHHVADHVVVLLAARLRRAHARQQQKRPHQVKLFFQQ